MDTLSDVLKSARLEGAFYINAEFTAPWCIRGKCGQASVQQRLAGADHVVYFHFIAEGGCKVRLADGTQVLDVAAGDLIQMRHGGGGAATRFVCGYLACHRSVCRPLLDALPRVLRIPVGDAQASALLRELLRAAVNESSASRPGAASKLAKLSELMFVEALRRYVENLPPRGKGWLAGARIAERSGYESNAAFSHAFKREFAMGPAAWRSAAAK